LGYGATKSKFAEAETVSNVEGNMCGTAMEGLTLRGLLSWVTAWSGPAPLEADGISAIPCRLRILLRSPADPPAKLVLVDDLHL
jgi:hypothetical protein